MSFFIAPYYFVIYRLDGEVGNGTMQDATDAEAELQLWKR